MTSIRQNLSQDALPDFRNLGVIVRILLASNIMAAAVAVAAAPEPPTMIGWFVQAAVLVEPVALASIVVLALVQPGLARLPYWAGAGAVLAIVSAVAWTARAWMIAITGPQGAPSLTRVLVLAVLTVVVLLGYFRQTGRAYSPALAQARLQALQARIRPHFLFNSLNAVLSLIRRDPRRAEHALEDLADLFRTLMSDARQFVRLADEIALLERYASLEQLRLGPRLRISWELDGAPADVWVPPLMLQPLLENAVYHGVEHEPGPADVIVRIEGRAGRLRVVVENPYNSSHAQHSGNRIALENIRERLRLLFDAEARLETRVEGSRFRTVIEFPCRDVDAVATDAGSAA